MERVPCEPSPDCKFFGRCYEDVDHIYWPKKGYQTPVEKEFRDLDTNKQLICRALHDERHATEVPPLKPDRDFMFLAIQRATREVA